MLICSHADFSGNSTTWPHDRSSVKKRPKHAEHHARQPQRSNHSTHYDLPKSHRVQHRVLTLRLALGPAPAGENDKRPRRQPKQLLRKKSLPSLLGSLVDTCRLNFVLLVVVLVARLLFLLLPTDCLNGSLVLRVMLRRHRVHRRRQATAHGIISSGGPHSRGCRRDGSSSIVAKKKKKKKKEIIGLKQTKKFDRVLID